jgi:hypothetical protein
MLKKHGYGILHVTYRCKALTLDYFSSENTRQKKLIKLSIDQKIPLQLIFFIKKGLFILNIKDFKKTLIKTNNINQEDAEWIIQIWEEGLFDFFYEFLFSDDKPQVIEIIGNSIQLPDWLSDMFEIFLDKIDPEKMFWKIKIWDSKTDGPDYRSFSFENLFAELEKKTVYQISNYLTNKTMSRLKALVAIKKYATNIPCLFEIHEFERNIGILKNWGSEENTFMRGVVINHLAREVKVSQDAKEGYDKKHGEFILLLLSLNHPEPIECFFYLAEKGTFLFDVHFKFIPQILLGNSEKSKLNLIYSMLKNKWIRKFGAVNTSASKFLKIKQEVDNRFRLKSNPLGAVYILWGSFISGAGLQDDKYEIGRILAINLFMWMFTTCSFLSFWTQRFEYSPENLTKVELLHTVFFGLIAALWGCYDLFSHTNHLGKHKTNLTLIGESIWSIIGVGLSVFFILFPGIWDFYPLIYFIEYLWFLGYFGIIKN